MTGYKLSDLGFVIPDFDFDSSDALVPIDNPSFSLVEFDLAIQLRELENAVGVGDIDAINRHLGFFKTAIISNAQKLKDEATVAALPVCQLFTRLLNRISPRALLYETLCVLTAWSGAQGFDADFYANGELFAFLLELVVVPLSDPKFDGDRRVGRAAVSALRNLLFHSDKCRYQFVTGRGLDLFTILYYEIASTDWKLRDAIIWTVINAMMVEGEAPIEGLDPVLDALSQVFSFGITAVQKTEMILACSYVGRGASFARRFVNRLDMKALSMNFGGMAPETQVSALDLFRILFCHEDAEIAAMCASSICWGTIAQAVAASQDLDVSVQFAYCKVVCVIFESRGRALSSSNMSCMIAAVLSLCGRRCRHKVKIMAIDAVSNIVRLDHVNVMDVVAAPEMVETISVFLESDWPELMRLGINLLIYIVQYALNGHFVSAIVKAVGANEIPLLVERACVNERMDEAIQENADILRAKVAELCRMAEYEYEYEEEEERVVPATAPSRPEEDESEDEWEDA